MTPKVHSSRTSKSLRLAGTAIPLVILAFAIAGFSFLYLRNHWPADAPPLRIGYQQSPPYQILGPNGEPGGIAIDIIKRAADKIGLELQWTYQPESPDFCFENDKVDLWPIVTDIPYRRKHIHITRPIYKNSLGMLTLAQSPIRVPSDTVGKRIAFYNREPGISLVKQLFPGAVLVPMPGNVQTIKSIFQGEADAAFLWSTKANSLSFKQAIDEHPDMPFKCFFFENSKITCGIGGSLTTPRAAKAADLLREEVRKMATNGEVQEIYFKYYLDPENEISSYFYVSDLERRNLLLTISIAVVCIGMILLIIMAIQLRISRQAAFAASESKSAFLANMSHEIRTPLNGVITMTELALSTDLTPDQRYLIHTAHESADTLLTIVNDILDVSRIEARKLVIVNQRLCLHELIESCVKFFELNAHQKEIDLNIRYSDDCPVYILGDAIRLRQILFNLIGNAIKYTLEGSITAYSYVEHRTDAKPLLVIEIVDTGIGIPKDKQEIIFEVFAQVDTSNTRKYGGSGLGLTICRNLVSLMHGTIGVDSELGKGSTFRVKLPLQVAADPAPMHDPFVPEMDQDGSPTAQHPTLHILLVDDNPINLKIAATVLKRHQHTSELVQSGLEAIEKVKTRSFDLILMDLQMPYMDGYETTRAIRKWEKETGNYTPIVALTACVLNNEEVHCIKAGMDGYLSKPLKVKTLIQRIQQLAGKPKNALL